MSDTLEYKNYSCLVRLSTEDECFVGKILGIRSLILVSGDSFGELKESFKRAVDTYLAACAERNIEPEKPCSGSFNVRVGPDLHREATVCAAKRGQKLNELVKRAIHAEVRREEKIVLGRLFSTNIVEVVGASPWDTDEISIAAVGTGRGQAHLEGRTLVKLNS